MSSTVLDSIVDIFCDRTMPGDSARAAYIARRTPGLARAVVLDDHAMALLMRDVCHDIAANPTPGHERLLLAVRNGDDAALATEFRLLIARYVVDAAKDSAADTYDTLDLELAA